MIPKQFVCNHCKGDIRIRNPNGFCDHFYYPIECPTCAAGYKKKLRPSSEQFTIFAAMASFCRMYGENGRCKAFNQCDYRACPLLRDAGIIE